ncbi:MAG: ubiquitin-like small modifier protein 1 [Candidatus Bathyarchaeia archaeon]
MIRLEMVEEKLTMKVKVKFFAALRDLAGLKEADVELADGSTVTDLLQELTNRFGEPFKKYVFDEKTGKPRGYLQFLLDGRNISNIEGFNTKLKGGENFAIIPPVGGGQTSLR